MRVTKAMVYEQRAQELMLTPEMRSKFIALSVSGDETGKCPGCGENVSGYEGDRWKHARTCGKLS